MRISGVSFITILAAIAASSLVSSSVHGQQSPAECAEIENDQKRLECFDRVFSRPAEDAGASRADRRENREEDSRRRSSSAAAEPGTTEPERRATGSTSRARRPDPQPRSQPEPESTEDSFGLENKVLDLGGQTRTSKAIGQFGFWERGQRVELENGQVWQIVDDDELYYKATNPKVTIKKGLLGSHYLHLDGISKSVKIKRIR